MLGLKLIRVSKSVPWPFVSYRWNDDLWCFPYCKPQNAIGETLELPVFENAVMEFCVEIERFHSEEFSWKCRLHNGGHFVSASLW